MGAITGSDARLETTFYYQMVYWYPPIEWLKCNTNGVSKDNLGLSTYDFCIRNGDGNLVWVEANGIGMNTNMMAEATTIVSALKYCHQRSYKKIILETDSLSLAKVMKGC